MARARLRIGFEAGAVRRDVDHGRRYVRVMPEQRANLGPKYAIRLGDLRNWHLLTAVCGACRHRRQMRLWQLKARHPDDTQ